MFDEVSIAKKSKNFQKVGMKKMHQSVKQYLNILIKTQQMMVGGMHRNQTKGVLEISFTHKTIGTVCLCKINEIFNVLVLNSCKFWRNALIN